MIAVGDNVTVEWTWGGSRFKAAGVVAKISGKTVKVRLTEHAGEHFAPGFIVTAQAQNVHKDSTMKTNRSSVHTPRMDSFTVAYFEAALWSTTDESDERGGEPLDANYGIDDFAPETRDKMIADCADFQARFGSLIEDDDSPAIDKWGRWVKAGHDFWLTRNGHGAGFWDGDWPKQGDALTDASKEYGEFYLYVGDDGRIYGPSAGAHGVREAREGGCPSGSKPFMARYVHKIAPSSKDVKGPFCINDNAFSNSKTLGAALRKAGVLHAGARVNSFRVEGDKVIVFPRMPGLTTYWYSVVLTHADSADEAREVNETHQVADFDTLEDLIRHAHNELGATHLSGWDAHTKIYFPRGGQHPYEEATVWRKNGYWHAQGPGARTGVAGLPKNARAIKAGRRAAEPKVKDYEAVDNHGRHIAGPFKSYGDAKDAAGTAGHVKYVRRQHEIGEARRKGGGYTSSQRAENALIDDIFLDGHWIGYTAGPFRRAAKAKDFYTWSLRSVSPDEHPPFGMSGASGEAKTRRAALNAVIQADKARIKKHSGGDARRSAHSPRT